MQAAAAQKTKSLGHKQRRKMLLEVLPRFAFKVGPAAREVGYSDYYATNRLPAILKADVSFCEALDRLKAINIQNSKDKVAACDRKLADLLDSGGMTHTNQLKGLELYFRRFGALADRQITEDTTRQAELTEAQQAEARRYAKWSLRERNKQALEANKAG
jgi:hypothetical protein